MKLVVIESPYAPKTPRPKQHSDGSSRAADCVCKRPNMYGDPPFVHCDPCCRLFAWWDELNRNLSYARAALQDCLRRGEAGYASHLLYTQEGVLDDTLPEERRLGMDAGFAWGAKAELVVVYTDLGISRGMEAGMLRAKMVGTSIEMRTLPAWVAADQAAQERAQSIDTLDLSVRVDRTFRQHTILTVEQVRALTPEDLKRMGLGAKFHKRAIAEALAAWGKR